MRVREIGQVGQIICDCGRVAELRTRKNGNRLPFLQCKSCGMKQGKAPLREKWLAAEDPTCSLGVFGEFPENSTVSSNQTSENVEPELMTSSKQVQTEHQKDWQPPEELLPEAIEPEINTDEEEEQATSKGNMGLLFKVGLGLLGLLAAGAGAKKIKSLRKIKG